MTNPVVTVKNDASIDIYVAGNDNWDDQKLLINGRARGLYTLTKGATIKVSVKWDHPADDGMMGVDFAQTRDYGNGPYLTVTVGQDQTGNLAITEEFTSHKLLDVKYALSDQAPFSMTMTFTDA